MGFRRSFRMVPVLIAALSVSGFAFGTWTSRNPTPHGETITGLTWSGSQWVEVGYGGAIFTSPDGETWTPRVSGTKSILMGVDWTGGQYIALGMGGTILTSPDGITWTARVSGTSNQLRKALWNGSQYLAVGLNGTVLTSPDAVTWTARTSGTAETLSGIVWDGSKYVVTGFNGVIVTSPDGVTWTSRTSNTANTLYSVAWSGSLYVASGNFGTIVTSPDGVTWTALPSIGSGHMYTVLWTGTQFVSTGSSGKISTSPDGVTWTARTSPATSGDLLQGSGWNGSKFVVAGYQGIHLTSTDAVTWTGVRNYVTLQQLLNVAWGNSRFVVVGNLGTILTSPEGATWTTRTSNIPGAIQDVIWADSQFVLAASGGRVSTSPDGVTWTARTTGTSNTLNAITRGVNKLVTVGDGGTILTSPDGVSWTSQTSGTSSILRGVAYGSGKFATVGSGGLVRTSPDGVTWTARTSGISDFLTDVAWAGDKFIAVGASGRIITSPDGVTWTTRTSGTSATLSSVAWTGGTAVCVGDEGTIVTSSDGVTWTARFSGSGSTLSGVGSNGERVLALGFPGIILSAERPLPVIAYQSPKVYIPNFPIPTLNPSNTGSAATSWSISPALPASLSFNTSTGAITGTPSGEFGATSYTVIATNSEGSDTAVVSIASQTPAPVYVMSPPTGLGYTSTFPVYSLGVGITMNRASVSGGTDSLTFNLQSGTLPTGVNLNPANGNLYGTPTQTGVFPVDIAVFNRVGGAMISLVITVRDPAPVIDYGSGSYAYPLGSAISTLAPSNAGGVARLWSITPDLTANTGLLFNATTGKITGTPTRIATDTAYVVTATGVSEAYTHSVPLVVRITPVAPGVSYDPAPQTYAVNVAITPLSKTGATGLVSAYSIAPALPDGLRFNTTTGQIIGTPTTASPATDYVITAHGPGGQGRDTVNIAVATPAPTVSYDNTPLVWTVGNSASLTKTGKSGIITRYLVAPALPAGLVFNATTGAISGTPAAVSEATPYTITAQGPGGSGSDTVTISTVTAAPTVAYANTPLVWTTGIEASLAKTGKSGIVTGYSIAPALPGDLVFNATTGAISGTPRTVLPATDFVVTVHGPGGTGKDTVNITVLGVAPTVTYADDPVVWALGAPASLAKTGKSGIIARYSIAPALPGDLVFNTTTGAISGTPRTVLPATDFVVTAHGPGGTGLDTLRIQVVPPARKTAAGTSETFSLRVTAKSGSMYALRIPAAFGTAERVTADVADLAGRRVWSQSVDPRTGAREVEWNGKSADGRIVPAGLYTVRLRATVAGKTSTLTGKAVTLER